MNALKQLYSAASALEAHNLRLFLEAHGIDVKVFGDNNALESMFAFTPASAPGVYVRNEDFGRAAELLEQFLDPQTTRPKYTKWRCAKCGETVEGQFDLCWNCESPRTEGVTQCDSPILTDSTVAKSTQPETTEIVAPPPPADASLVEVSRNRRDLWLELCVVLAVAWFPNFAYSVMLDAFPRKASLSFIAESILTMINFVPTIAVVLYVMQRSGSPWRYFGVRRPRLILDVAAGVAIWIVTHFLVSFLQALASTAAGSQEVSDLGRSSYEFAHPSTFVDYVFVVLVSITIGLGEELSMRSYLIPRLEQLLNSTTKTVLVSSLVFASYHMYQGIGPTIWIFFVGLSFGIAFCWVRRLWPLMTAHSIADIVAIIAGN